MGDARDICPHLDSIGEVTKEDLLLKSQVEEQSSGTGVQPWAAMCLGRLCEAGQHCPAPSSAKPSVCNGPAGICLRAFFRPWVLLPLISLDQAPRITNGTIHSHWVHSLQKEGMGIQRWFLFFLLALWTSAEWLSHTLASHTLSQMCP